MTKMIIVMVFKMNVAIPVVLLTYCTFSFQKQNYSFFLFECVNECSSPCWNFLNRDIAHRECHACLSSGDFLCASGKPQFHICRRNFIKAGQDGTHLVIAFVHKIHAQILAYLHPSGVTFVILLMNFCAIHVRVTILLVTTRSVLISVKMKQSMTST